MLKVWVQALAPNKNRRKSQAPVAHACNPSYSGGRDQEDRGLKSAWANSSRDPIPENQGVGPKFKPQIEKKNNRKKERKMTLGSTYLYVTTNCG
jgi:hypothetical protein